jgi:threonylcarbamoyladenosine tRNA methylthiotransferase MtaB
VRQARQAIRKLKRERPQARILVTGCAAQTEPDTFAAMAEVDRVIGNDEKMRPDAWADTRAFLQGGPFGIGAEQKIAVNDIMAVKETAAHLIDGLDGRARADPAPGRQWLSRGGADRRRPHELRRQPAEHAAARAAGEADP